MNLEFQAREEVVKALVGSHNYNLNTPDSDKDWKFFVAPTFADLYYKYCFSHGEQSEEMDYTVHDVRHLASLVWKANVNFLEVLFSKELTYDPALAFLFDNREKWAGMNLPAFRNATYNMHLTKVNELHKGTAKTDVLVEKFGYDTKQACHALRCLYVLEKYAEEGSMEKALWFNKGVKRDTLLKVKAGGYTESEFKGLVEHWHTHVWGELAKAYNDTRPDEDARVELENLMFEYVKNKVKNA